MDESDSDSEPQGGRHDDEDEEKYPIDGMFVNLKEKEEIMAMREFDREQILAERAADIERQRQNRQLRQLVARQEDMEQKQQKKKRNADAADLGDGQRKTSRQRTRLDGTKVGETSSAMGTLLRARAEKSDRQRRREEDQKRQKDRHSTHGRDGDPDGDDEDDDWLGRPSRNSRSPEKEIHARELPPPELKDFNRVRLGRRQYAEFGFNPGFEEAVVDCYVRINLGSSGSQSGDVYRMARIVGKLTQL
jgi:RNA polymerase-associated protein RTF1